MLGNRVKTAVLMAGIVELFGGGAPISGDPNALADDLEKMEYYAQGLPLAAAEEHPATAQLMIVNPLFGRGVQNMFRTHPVTEARIARLRAMRWKPVLSTPVPV